MPKKFRVSIIAGLIFLLFAVSSYAQITTTLTAEPASYSGVCPAEIRFKGTITSGKPGKVQYRFIRDDGILMPVETLEFKTPGTKEVESAWSSGGTGLTAHEGWQAIRIVYPEEIESNKAQFKAACETALAIKIKNVPKSAKPGRDLGTSVKARVANNTKDDLKDISIDIILRKDALCPLDSPKAEYSPHFSSGVLLKGGHEKASLAAGKKQDIKPAGPNTIPADTPPGDYFVCAVADARGVVKESKDAYYCACAPIRITPLKGKPDLIIEKFRFKGWGKCEPNQPIFYFEVTVANVGSAPSPAMPDKAVVQVMDIPRNDWGNSAGLNSIPPGGRQTVEIPVYYFSKDPVHMTKKVPHPFRAIVDPFHLIDEPEKSRISDIIYLDPGLVCGKDNK